MAIRVTWPMLDDFDRDDNSAAWTSFSLAVDGGNYIPERVKSRLPAQPVCCVRVVLDQCEYTSRNEGWSVEGQHGTEWNGLEWNEMVTLGALRDDHTRSQRVSTHTTGSPTTLPVGPD